MRKLMFVQISILALFVFCTVAYSAEPTGYWRFEETAWNGTVGEVKDSSGSNDGTAGNGATTDAAGKFGRCAILDGVDDYIEIPNSAGLNPTETTTMMCWFSAADGTLANQKFIMLKSFTAHSAPYYQYGFSIIDKEGHPKTLGFSLTIADAWSRVPAAEAAYGYDQWHHLAGTYDGAVMKLYLDGVELGSTEIAGALGGYDTPLLIGAYGNLDKVDTYCFGGKVDEVAIFDTVLSEDEIKQAMQLGVQSVTTAVESTGKLATAWGEIKAVR